MTPVAEHHEWLPEWLESDAAPQTSYRLLTYGELARPDDAAARLARMVVEAKSRTASLARLLSRVGWMTESARLSPSKRPQLRHGDFGEVLTIGMLDAFDGIPVPVMKLRVQMDPEQSLHGADVVGFALSDSPNGLVLDSLEFVEVKCQTTRHKDVVFRAHEQLKNDAEGNFQDTLEFIFQRLDELGEVSLLEAFEEYLASRQDGPGGNYRLVIVSTSEVWQDDEIAELPDEPDRLSPLRIDIVLVDEMRQLIDATWEEVGRIPLEAS